MTNFVIDPRVNAQVDEHPYPTLFVTISGAHLYGFPSPDSDYDIRGAHVVPLAVSVGLWPDRNDTIQVERIREGLEVDLVTHDVRKFFGLMLRRNGYVMEQVFSPLIVRTTPEHEELKVIAKQCLTRHHSHHSFGFLSNPVASLREGTTETRQTVALRVSSFADRHSLDAHGRSRSESRHTQ